MIVAGKAWWSFQITRINFCRSDFYVYIQILFLPVEILLPFFLTIKNYTNEKIAFYRISRIGVRLQQ